LLGRGRLPIRFLQPPLFRQEQTQPPRKAEALASPLMERLDGQRPGIL
jgi:hypothetical protein